MSLTLTVDGERWRRHLRAVADATPGLTPVVKGNGYGFTLGRLARKSAWLGVQAIAVGTYVELPEVATRFDGDLLVLTPWRPFVADLDPALTDRVIHTVGRVEDLDALLDASARRPDRARAAHLHEAARVPRPRPVDGGRAAARPPRRGRPLPARGRRAAPAAGAGLAPRRGTPADERRRRRRARRVSTPSGSATSPRTSWPRCARRTPTSRSAPAPVPACGWATAGRCR